MGICVLHAHVVMTVCAMCNWAMCVFMMCLGSGC